MTHNENIITQFYTAFQNKDFVTMQNAYADSAHFSDAVFINLNAKEVRAMWQMLITGSTDLELTFNNVKADEKTGSADWVATYTFTRSGKKVVNRIHAEFQFENDKIIDHKDNFSFPAWAKQALGFSGLLLGNTKYLKNKVQQLVRKNLDNFMGN